MLERLEAERRRTSSAALQAQEQERARVARDLHDEVNQALTGLLLRLEAVRDEGAARAQRRAGRDEGAREPGDGGAAHPRPRAAAHRPRRPSACGRAGRAGRRDRAARPDRTPVFESEGDFRALPSDVQLVVYRVAQEAMSNAIRHADAQQCARTALPPDADAARRWSCSVGDDGRASRSTRRRPGSAWRACASGRCSWAGTFASSRGPSSGRGCGLSVPVGSGVVMPMRRAW